MEKDLQNTIGDALNQSLGTGPENLLALAKRLAVWATINNTNDDGSRLRERGYILAGAIVDWAQELYPDFQIDDSDELDTRH